MGRLISGLVVGCALVVAALVGDVLGQGQPPDQLTIAFDVSMAPTFLEPAETSGIGTPFKRIVIKGVPDITTRLATLKTGEADTGYLMIGLEGETVRADPRLRLVHVIPSAAWWLEFPEQWAKAKSPWQDRRVRLAANLALDKQAIKRTR